MSWHKKILFSSYDNFRFLYFKRIVRKKHNFTVLLRTFNKRKKERKNALKCFWVLTLEWDIVRGWINVTSQNHREVLFWVSQKKISLSLAETSTTNCCSWRDVWLSNESFVGIFTVIWTFPLNLVKDISTKQSILFSWRFFQKLSSKWYKKPAVWFAHFHFTKLSSVVSVNIAIKV